MCIAVIWLCMALIFAWLERCHADSSSFHGCRYGAFPPRTWPEALVWCIAMVTVASLFAVINGFIVAAILSSARGRHRYKERMDNVMVGVELLTLPCQAFCR